MPQFVFVARTGAGQAQRGTEEASSAAALVDLLRRRGWLVVDVRPTKTSSVSLGDWLRLVNPFAWLGPRSVDIELSLQQMAVMLRSGLTLLSCLKTIAEQARRWSMQLVWEDVAERIQQGSTLVDAMGAHRCFSHLVVQLVRVGEQTGTLEQVVSRAAEALERRRLLRTHLLTALAYPTVVFLAAIGVAVFMIVSVIPKLQVFLTAVGRKLPASTQLLLDISNVVQRYALYTGIGVFVLTSGVISLYVWPPGRLFLDRLILRVPLLGTLLKLAGTALFAHSLGVLLVSGITLVEALRTVEALLGNRFLKGCVARTRQAVLAGASLAGPLAEGGTFMPMLSRMVAVGESAGSLDNVLGEVARFHENQLQNKIRWLSVIVEPAIVVAVGGIVGFVYISFFQAMFAAAGAGGKIR